MDKFDLKKGLVFAATVVKVDKEEEVISVWGSGEEERDLLYVSDLVECINCVLDKQDSYYELINVGTGKSHSITNLVKNIISLSGKNLTIKYDETKPSIKTKLAVNITKAKKLFGWSPRVSLNEGILKTLEWYAAQNKGEDNGVL